MALGVFSSPGELRSKVILPYFAWAMTGELVQHPNELSAINEIIVTVDLAPSECCNDHSWKIFRVTPAGGWKRH